MLPPAPSRHSHCHREFFSRETAGAGATVKVHVEDGGLPVVSGCKEDQGENSPCPARGALPAPAGGGACGLAGLPAP